MNELRTVEPLEHTSINEAVYRRMRDHLMRGDYAAGQVLSIQELADAFGTSAMPVREALRRLAAQKALEPMKSRSMRIPVISIERLEDILRARLLIEGAVTAWAVERISEKDIAVLRHLADRIGQALSDESSVLTGLDSNQEFHFTIYRAAGSDSMMAVIESLWLQSGPYLRAMRELMHSSERPSLEFHAHIVDAIVRRDAHAAQEAMEQDIRWAFDRLLERHAALAPA